MRVVLNWVCIAILTVAVSAVANENKQSGNWHLERDKLGIQIYTRPVQGSAYDEVKGVTLFDARLSSLIAVVRDTKACSDWADLCAK